MITIQDLNNSYRSKSNIIKTRLAEFEYILRNSDDNKLFEEMVFCILTAGTSAKLCLEVIPEIKDIIHSGSKEQITQKLRGCYRFYNIRADYIFVTREYLKNEFNLEIGKMLLSFEDPLKRRDFLAQNKNIKGLGYKESSHFLRNIGFKGYAILDKHIISFLNELGVINEAKSPSNRKKYIEIECGYKEFAINNGFDIDELDLLLWSEKTGTILK